MSALEELIIEIAKMLVFPGIVFCILLAFFYQWLDRKIHARIQRRRGPMLAGPWGLFQPIADFLKLLSKEDITVEGVDKFGFNILPIIELAVSLYLILFIPIIGLEGLISIPGDLIFILFVSTLFSVIIIFAGYFSANRFSLVGSERAGLLFISYEIPLFISLITPAIIANALEISAIVKFQNNSLNPLAFYFVYLLLIAPSFIIYIICMMAKLERVPFDVPEAESEIIAGWATEYTGKKLALFFLAKDVQQLFLIGLGAALFIGGPVPLPYLLNFVPQSLHWLVNLFGFVIKGAIIVMLISLIRSIAARYRIDQIRDFFWKILVPISVIQLVVVIGVIWLFDPITWVLTNF